MENWEVGQKSDTAPRNGEGGSKQTTGSDLGRFVCVACAIRPERPETSLG